MRIFRQKTYPFDMKQTQRQWVEKTLKENGKITRNFALQNFISRLGAIICDMKADGWEIEATRNNGDYVYTLVQAPKKKIYTYETIMVNGIRVAKEIISYV